MTEMTRDGLRALLEAGYSTFRERLRRRLGSVDSADEALQETWLRLAGNGNSVVVHNPGAYVYRTALNIAADHRTKEVRQLNLAEVHAVLHMADDAIDPEQIAEAQEEINALEAALAELSPRRRAIVILARVEGVAHDEIARRFGVSVRMIDKELRRALDHCGERLNRKVIQRFGPRPRKGS
jgi:RNA polymerase sigma factor (sigma-70 family)